MADNDYNIIKPVEGLQNIAGLTGAKRREERKRRQNLPGGHEEERESENQENRNSNFNHNENDRGPRCLDPARDSPARSGQEPAGTPNDRHSIDYCA